MKLKHWLVVGAMGVSAAAAAAGRDDDEEKNFDFAPMEMMAPAASPMRMQVGQMGATPGGAQDIAFARDRIQAGEVPHANTFTPEGLFSEHDLPLDTGRKCQQILCLTSAAAPVDLLAQPEARSLGQLGFASNLDAATWRRAPVNLVAVIDKSGSMAGQPLETVKASLRQIVRQLGPDDQISIVLYGDRVHAHLAPTRAKDKAALEGAIAAIESSGSTNMEAGLQLGFDLARQTAGAFKGSTRVMLFTDERPNVGATDKGSFMGMAREASAQGIGMTTIGVSVQFGAELATAISSVRGGNLFYFPDAESMTARFEKDLDVMLTELAFDLKLSITPRKGYEIVGLYGLPGDLVKRTAAGGLEMTIETIFLSKEKGGIFFAFAPEGGGALPAAPGPLADAAITYTGTDGKAYRDQVDFALWSGDGALPLGLARGRMLVDEVTALKKAATLHLEKNDQEGAYQLVRALAKRFAESGVPGLEKELAVISKLDETLTRLSGHQGEPGAPLVQRDGVSGLPR